VCVEGVGPLSARQRLLLLMVDALEFGDRGRVDAVLVGPTRWLEDNPYDAVILEARDHLRAKFRPTR
jgi:hypothetical protein